MLPFAQALPNVGGVTGRNAERVRSTYRALL